MAIEEVSVNAESPRIRPPKAPKGKSRKCCNLSSLTGSSLRAEAPEAAHDSSIKVIGSQKTKLVVIVATFYSGKIL